MKEQIAIKENALKQERQCQEYKKIMAKQPAELWHILLTLLSEPLAANGGRRTDAHQLTMELLLHLFCHVQSPALLKHSLYLDILIVLGQDMESHQGYNLLYLELLHSLLQPFDPTIVATTTNTTTKPMVSRLKTTKYKTPLRHANFGPTLVAANGKPIMDGKYAAPTHVKQQGRTSNSVLLGTRAMYNSSSKTTTQAYSAPIHDFLQRFILKSLGPVMKSWKKEFRRDTARLEPRDKPMFFYVLWFLFQWYRLTHNNNNDKSSSMGPMIFGLDVFTIHLVVNSIDDYHLRKQYKWKEQSIALYTELIYGIHRLYHSKHDPTEHTMALGLLDKVFYQKDAFDRLPKLLSQSHTCMDTMCDVMEATHVTLSLLTTHDQSLDRSSDEKAVIQDAMYHMMENAKDFDVACYMERKIVTHSTICLCATILSKYKTLTTTVLQHTAHFLNRILHYTYDTDGDTTTTTTMAPMLFHIKLLMVLEKILNDRFFTNEAIKTVASDIMLEFHEAAQENPLLYVEVLLKPIHPRKYCHLTCHHYVTEEHTLMLQKQALLEEAQSEQQQQEEDEEHVQNKKKKEHVRRNAILEDSEDELELMDDSLQENSPSKKRKIIEHDDDSDDELELEDEGKLDLNDNDVPTEDSKKRKVILDEDSDLEESDELDLKDDDPSPLTNQTMMPENDDKKDKDKLTVLSQTSIQDDTDVDSNTNELNATNTEKTASDNNIIHMDETSIQSKDEPTSTVAESISDGTEKVTRRRVILDESDDDI